MPRSPKLHTAIMQFVYEADQLLDKFDIPELYNEEHPDFTTMVDIGPSLERTRLAREIMMQAITQPKKVKVKAVK